MRGRDVFLLAGILGLLCGSAMADPPPDDVCAGANELQRCASGHVEGDLTLYNNDYDSPT